MKIAVSGIGLRSGYVLSILKQAMPEVEFVGIYDPTPTHQDMIGGDIRLFDSIEDLLSTTKPDMFFVGSPNRFHLDDIRAGLEADVPYIFAEKPVVISIAETMELAKLLGKHQGSSRVMVGLVLRYSRHMIDLQAVQNAGVLGQIVSMEANEHIGPYHGAFFMRDWRRKTKNSGGFMLEKCCHDLDLYNMISGSRPQRVASFGGRRSFVPQYAPEAGSMDDVFQVKKSVWDSADDPFQSDADIVDFQTAILSYENGSSLSFHTNLNVPDEQRRFCVMGSLGMAEGDFVRGRLKVTRRDATIYADHDYSQDPKSKLSAHYGADHLMVDDLTQYLRGETKSLPVSVVDALEAGIAALALDEARTRAQVVDLSDTWAELDDYKLRTIS